MSACCRVPSTLSASVIGVIDWLDDAPAADNDDDEMTMNG